MLAASGKMQTAMTACQCSSERLPFSMPAMCMFFAASIITIGTGVITSVSLFVWMLLILTLLIVSIVLIISLTLTGLAGLVGLTTRLAAVKGD